MKNTLYFYIIGVVLLIIAAELVLYILEDTNKYSLPRIYNVLRGEVIVDSSKIKYDSLLALKKDSTKQGIRTKTKQKPKDNNASLPISNEIFVTDPTQPSSQNEQPAGTTGNIQSGGPIGSISSGGIESQFVSDKERKKLLKLYESMPPEKIAELLDMTKDDNAVREIIFMLKERKASKVLQLLPPERVQKILGLKKDTY
ncbi:MAG: hypothetical protein FJ218_02695 [Ignavibacteria bacterium]|nr:hypothetical protein [Ignavibacteria bacterium]